MFVPETLLQFLDKEEIYYKLYRHAPIGSGDNAYLFPKTEGTVVKNLVLRTKKGKLVLFTLPLNDRADLKQVATLLQLPRFSFARTADLAFLGVPPGMVSPLALLNDIGQELIYAEPSELSAYPLINCHPLRNNLSIDIKLEDVHELIERSGHRVIRLKGALLA